MSTAKIAALNVANENLDAIAMTSNVARDALKRASDFPNQEAAIFEAVANAYESYNFGTVPFIKVATSYNKAKKEWTVSISDQGIGMCSKLGLVRYFALHEETTRREGGLNMRGYNGTGKVAPFKYGDTLVVDTVKDGVRNVVKLTKAELESAKAEKRPPLVQFLVRDKLTTDPNGTTVTVSGIKSTDGLKSPYGFHAENMAKLKEKFRIEQMMWMKSAVIELNGEIIPPRTVEADDITEVVSECGNFTALIHYSERGYANELPFVYISAGRVFLARENFGKEGSSYSNRIHVDVRASEAWAEEFFYKRREDFVSEARDLKLKMTHPQARVVKEFCEKAIGEYIDAVAAREEERRRAEMDEHKAELEKTFAKLLNSLMRTLGGQKVVIERSKVTPEPEIGPKVERESNPRNGDDQNNMGGFSVAYASFDAAMQYRITEPNKIELNNEYVPLKSVAGDTSSPIYQMVSHDMLVNAAEELYSSRELAKKYEEGRVPPLAELLVERNELVQAVRGHFAGMSLKCITDLRDMFA